MTSRRMINSLLYYLLTALGISMTVKAMVGVSSFTSLNVTLSGITTIKVGTITAIINGLFLIACWLLDNRRHLLDYAIMLGGLLLFGSAINLFLYHVLSLVQLPNYWVRLLFFTLGSLVAGFGTGRVLALSLLKFPIEYWCMLLVARSHFSFSFYRYGVDVICVLLAIALALIWGQPLAVREGTIISLFLLSAMIGWAKDLGVATQK